MLRRISTKWVLAVLATVVLPFLGFAWYVDGALAHRLSWDVVRYYLLNLSADLADRIDGEVERFREHVQLLADQTLVEWAVDTTQPDHVEFVEEVELQLDRFLRQLPSFHALLGIDAEGRLVFSNRVDGADRPLTRETLAAWHERAYAGEPWFQGALAGHTMLVDHHRSPLLPAGDAADPQDPADWHIGFATPVFQAGEGEEVRGVLYGLVGWDHFQRLIVAEAKREYFQGLIGADLYASSYAWLWGSDGDTILAHPTREILGTRVSQPPVDLPQLSAATQERDWGMYPEYTYRGVLKNAAFKHTAGAGQGGFGWVVGIGIDNNDIYATVNDLRQLLIKATLLVLGVVVLWTMIIARRATRPILELEEHTRRVAAGDLDARIAVRSEDELGHLGHAFNRMTAELRESREHLVRAEKEAAWREMARQVAHEIKNPLTPIQLSANLLQRARDEKSPDFDRIFDRTIDLIQRQVDNMRQIASAFHAFAGERHRSPQRFDLFDCVEEVLALNAAWAEELGVEVVLEGEPVEVFADAEEMKRVLINLVSNALEAMPGGGRLSVEVAEEAGRARVDIRDTGTGLSEEARERLFEPYFTTRSHGTGLGLAISKRVIDEMGGEISLMPAEGGGTLARILLPLAGAQ